MHVHVFHLFIQSHFPERQVNYANKETVVLLKGPGHNYWTFLQTHKIGTGEIAVGWHYLCGYKFSTYIVRNQKF